LIEAVIPSLRIEEMPGSPVTYDTVAIAVIDGATGGIAYNRPTLGGTIENSTDVVEPPLSTVSGPQTRSPLSWMPNGADEGSGPYRRIYTVTNTNSVNSISDPGTTGTAAVDGDVTLACGAVNNARGTYPDGTQYKDAGFEYLGGWSGTGVSPGGSVDAGLQADKGLSPSSSDDYAMMMNISGVGYWTAGISNGQFNKNGFRIPCGAGAVDMEFYPVGGLMSSTFYGTELNFDAGWLDLSSGKMQNAIVTYASSDPSFGGWEMGCPDCVFKRMTSIGQEVKLVGNTKFVPMDNLNDGSFIRSSWANAALSCGFDDDCNSPLIGNSGTLPWDPLATGGCMEFPAWDAFFLGTTDCSAGGSGSMVAVNDFSFSGEDDVISVPNNPAGPGFVAAGPITTTVPNILAYVNAENNGQSGIIVHLQLANISPAPSSVQYATTAPLIVSIADAASGNILYTNANERREQAFGSWTIPGAPGPTVIQTPPTVASLVVPGYFPNPVNINISVGGLFDGGVSLAPTNGGGSLWSGRLAPNSEGNLVPIPRRTPWPRPSPPRPCLKCWPPV